jgi:hypothetical protein
MRSCAIPQLQSEVAEHIRISELKRKGWRMDSDLSLFVLRNKDLEKLVACIRARLDQVVEKRLSRTWE